MISLMVFALKGFELCIFGAKITDFCGADKPPPRKLICWIHLQTERYISEKITFKSSFLKGFPAS